ncbi:hypothetical protein [Cronobacter sakazakii]|uniref:hypothetical protein n=1 Tax=Cronobacter sakazakii TaxID=28141 RepID=UPI002810A314|nr:hypothetical protein [Cronobacter sakazakii]MDQ9180131.1 hypothetical protein [Cronobacter sakazakii]MDQ9195764.1 hypothetical protein [Cronobacter sakazakii]
MRFVIRDPKKGRGGSSEKTPARCGTLTQDVAVHSAADDAICCVTALPRDPARSTGKHRYDYSSCVVHFRKTVNKKKIGSSRNGLPVIYRRVYMSAYYHHDNYDSMVKSSG